MKIIQPANQQQVKMTMKYLHQIVPLRYAVATRSSIIYSLHIKFNKRLLVRDFINCQAGINVNNCKFKSRLTLSYKSE